MALLWLETTCQRAALVAALNTATGSVKRSRRKPLNDVALHLPRLSASVHAQPANSPEAGSTDGNEFSLACPGGHKRPRPTHMPPTWFPDRTAAVWRRAAFIPM